MQQHPFFGYTPYVGPEAQKHVRAAKANAKMQKTMEQQSNRIEQLEERLRAVELEDKPEYLQR